MKTETMSQVFFYTCFGFTLLAYLHFTNLTYQCGMLEGILAEKKRREKFNVVRFPDKQPPGNAA